MGISYHVFKFLQLARKDAPLGDVLTFGHQNLNLSRELVQREYGRDADVGDGTYADSFLVHCLGATSVSSLDASPYEGATYQGDLNGEVVLDRQFDLVLDSGTLEHVFDIAAGFRNAIAHCRIGGRIIHAIPSNSDCGHGFYQLAPELFFSLYSEANGFNDTVVFLAKLIDETHWWRASPPRAGHRLMANSLSTTHVFCRTRKVADVAERRVQQSDYERAWQAGQASFVDQGGALARKGRSLLKNSVLGDVATLGYRTWLARTGVTRFNPNLQKVRIQALLEA